MLLLISKLALGSTLQAESALNLHPVAISGCLGLIVTALNLMPVGQLDGGHIVHAMYGQRTAAVVSQVARFLMLILSFVYDEFFLWAILLLFIPSDEPALNDVSELNGPRDFFRFAVFGTTRSHYSASATLLGRNDSVVMILLRCFCRKRVFRVQRVEV